MKKVLFVMALVMLNVVTITAQSRKYYLVDEDDGFQWILMCENGYEGALDIHGNTLIPLSRHYTDVTYICEEEDPPYFAVMDYNNKEGACTITGKEIIAPRYTSLIYIDGQFEYSNTDYINGNVWYQTGIALNSRGTDYYSIGHNSSNVSKSSGSNVNESSGSELVKGVAIGAGIIAAAVLIHDALDNSSSKSSNNKSGGSSNYNKASDVDNTIRVNSKVKCYIWGPKQNSGWHGRVTEINGDKCSVYIDKVVVKGWTQTVLAACEASGWKDLSYSTEYRDGKKLYGPGTIITVPKYYLEIDR